MSAFEAVGRGSIPRWGILTRDHECFVIEHRSRVEKDEQHFVLGVWWMHATLRRSKTGSIPDRDTE